jgi:hypothetical protein
MKCGFRRDTLVSAGEARLTGESQLPNSNGRGSWWGAFGI